MMRFVEFWDGPRQIFSFDQNLAELLSQTEVAEVPWEAVRLPYDVFYIHFGCVLEEAVEFKDRIYKVDGAYVRVQGGPSAVSNFLPGTLYHLQLAIALFYAAVAFT